VALTKGQNPTRAHIIRRPGDAGADLSAGLIISEVVSKLQMNEASYYSWRRQYCGMKADKGKS